MSNLKPSLNTFQNISNSSKTIFRNSIPETERFDSSTFMNLSIGFDRMSHASFSTNKNGEGNLKNSVLPTQSNNNQDINNSRVLNTRENLVTEHNVKDEGKFYFNLI